MIECMERVRVLTVISKLAKHSSYTFFLDAFYRDEERLKAAISDKKSKKYTLQALEDSLRIYEETHAALFVKTAELSAKGKETGGVAQVLFSSAIGAAAGASPKAVTIIDNKAVHELGDGGPPVVVPIGANCCWNCLGTGHRSHECKVAKSVASQRYFKACMAEKRRVTKAQKSQKDNRKKQKTKMKRQYKRQYNAYLTKCAKQGILASTKDEWRSSRDAKPQPQQEAKVE